MNFKRIIPLIFIAIAVIIAIHQYVYYNVIFELDDLHHETWILMFAFAGLILLALKK